MIKKYSLLVIFLIVSSIFTSINGKIFEDCSDLILDNLGIDNETVFDKKITSLMKIGHMPSLSACVIKNNQVVWAKSYYEQFTKSNA